MLVGAELWTSQEAHADWVRVWARRLARVGASGQHSCGGGGGVTVRDSERQRAREREVVEQQCAAHKCARAKDAGEAGGRLSIGRHQSLKQLTLTPN